MTTSDPRRLRPDHLPTPFTAEEIRAACQPGRQLRFRFERIGQEPIVHVARYVGGDERDSIQESWDETPAGDRVGELETRRETWLELQEHASFPAESTVASDETIEIPAGTFACLRYTQTVEDGTRSFWFPRDHPGQPFRWVIHAGDQVVVTVTLLENTPAPQKISGLARPVPSGDTQRI